MQTESSRLSDNPRKIYWMIWFLVGIGLVMVAVVIGLMTWRLGSIRTERAKLERAQEYRIQASNEILSRAALARDDLQSMLDETRPVVEKYSAVAKLSALVGGVLESKRDSPAHATLEKMEGLNRDMEEVERRVRNWRERYMPVWLDMIGQGSMGRVREAIAVMRRAVETREDRHRREQALQFKRWEALPAEDAAHIAQAILTGQRQQQDVELDRLTGNLAELALLAEVLGREERPVKLADLKDSKLRPALVRLGEDIAAIMSRPRADISITQQTVEDLRTALFGSGYVIDEARQVINPGTGGLYAQRESIQSLRHEREEIKESLSSISQQLQSAAIAFSQTVQTDSAVLTGQMEQMLTSTRRQMLLLGGVCSALFFWLAWLISRAIRGQVDALQRSRHFIEAVTSSSPDLIYVYDFATRQPIYGNRPTAHQLLGCRSGQLTSLDDTMQHDALIARLATGGDNEVIEGKFRLKSGAEWRRFHIRESVFMRLADGTPSQVIGTAHDISKADMLECQLRQAQKLESIGQLAAGIAHEINTPTQFIQDNIGFLQDAFNDLIRVIRSQQELLRAVKAGLPTDRQVAMVEQEETTADMEFILLEIPRAVQGSLEGTGRVAELVRSMKEFSHPGTKEKTLFNLNEAIKTTLTVCQNEWKYVANVVTDLDPDLPAMLCLPGEINQAILNIVVNACHAITDVVGESGARKGTITVSTRFDAESAEIRIHDTGTGIPEHARPQIFDPFFTTKEVGKGTGQGLAIAYSVVRDKHGGSIRFETELGKGTTFIIKLPLEATSAGVKAA
jgi:signal transduction histidine kinase